MLDSAEVTATALATQMSASAVRIPRRGRAPPSIASAVISALTSGRVVTRRQSGVMTRPFWVARTRFRAPTGPTPVQVDQRGQLELMPRDLAGSISGQLARAVPRPAAGTPRSCCRRGAASAPRRGVRRPVPFGCLASGSAWETGAIGLRIGRGLLGHGSGQPVIRSSASCRQKYRLDRQSGHAIDVDGGRLDLRSGRKWRHGQDLAPEAVAVDGAASRRPQARTA